MASDQVGALAGLATELAAMVMPREKAFEDLNRQHQRLRLRLQDHVLPRARNLQGPLLAVVGGSTGAGKSSIVNALVGENVSAASVLRPTTRRPVLISSARDLSYFASPDNVLPTLKRVDENNSGEADPWGSVQLVSAPQWLEELALIDAPDVDSVVEANRELAHQLLDAADMWIFVTTAMRYADALGWEYLIAAAKRNLTVAVVLNRVPAGYEQEVKTDLAALLAESGLGQAPIFVIPESSGQGISEEATQPLKQWLTELANDRQARLEVARQTLTGAVGEVAEQTETLLARLGEAHREVEAGALQIERAIERCVQEVNEITRDGTLLRAEVLARWQDVVGTGEFFRTVESKVGWLRDRVTGFFKGRQSVEPVAIALETGLTNAIAEAVSQAHHEVQKQWSRSEFERVETRLDEIELQAAAQRLVSDWQGDLLALIRSEGSDKRATARVLSIGVNVLGVALMLVIFATTGGLTGAEVGVAGASAVVAQRLLEAVFGDQAVRQMAAKARADLETRTRELCAQSLQPFTDALPHIPPGDELTERLGQVKKAWR